MPVSPASRRASANRAKGIRFERAIARKLRAAGFFVQRILEYDGFGTGCDLRIGRPMDDERDFEWLPVALQCKAVNNPHAWKAGLAEAKKAMPQAEIHACIHSYKGKITVYEHLCLAPAMPQTLGRFITYLQNKFLS